MISERIRSATGRAQTMAKNMIRRMVVGTTSGGLWQVLGFGDEGEPSVPLFPGIGFFSRPKAGNRAEAIVLRVGGGPAHPVIVATRDEDSRVEIDEDETVIFNSQGAMVHIRADGSVVIVSGDIRLGSSEASDPVALKSDLVALKNEISNAQTAPNDGGVALQSSLLAGLANWPVSSGKVSAE